jgi:hypothetical protein
MAVKFGKLGKAILKFSESDFVKKSQEAFKPYSSGAMIGKTVKGKYKSLVERMKKR